MAVPEKNRCSARLDLDFDGPEEADRVARALEPDNEGFLRSRLEGRTLVAEAEAQSIPGLLHTLDDYLACLSVAERVKRAGAPEEK